MIARRAKWRRGPLEVTLSDWRPRMVRVVAPHWGSATHRSGNAGSFRAHLMAITLPSIDGTGATTAERRWRRDALRTGRDVV